MKFRKMDHVGIVVRDLAAAKAFFLDFGFELVGEATLEGDWVDKVNGLDGVKSDIAVLRTPEGDANIELITYLHPPSPQDVQRPPANTPGIRNIAFVVDDIDAVVAAFKQKGIEPFGPVQQYQEFYKLCYIRGPEGIILMLAEDLQHPA